MLLMKLAHTVFVTRGKERAIYFPDLWDRCAAVTGSVQRFNTAAAACAWCYYDYDGEDEERERERETERVCD